MDVNFELYKIFYHTAMEGSFSKAASRLFITQSAVSQAVGGLEEKLGSRLFIRKSRNIKLTPEGEILYSHIEQAYNFIKSAEGKMSEMRSLDLGELRIGVGDTVCRYFLIPYLKKFISMYPKIKINVINRTSPQIAEILKKGQVDVGIVTMPMHDEALDVEDFMKVDDAFISSNRFPELKGRPVPLSELAGYPLLLLQKASSTRRNLEAFMKEKNIAVNPEIELESTELLVEFSRIGLGVAHVLKESAASLVEKGELFFVETLEKMPERRLGTAKLKNVPLSHAASKFIELANLKIR